MDTLCQAVLPLVRKRVQPTQQPIPETPLSLEDSHFHWSLRQYSGPEMDGELSYLQIVLPSDKAWRTHNYYKLVERQRHKPAQRVVSDSAVMSMTQLPVVEDIPVVLPSDPTWRLEIYFRMIDKQKHQPGEAVEAPAAPWPESSEDESEAKRPRVSEAAPRRRECRRSIQSAGGLCWSSADLALAATLLETPNARFPSVTFANPEEKRRVFTLVYDVLRYKSVLNQALNDLYFFVRYPELKEHCHLVWLLFFDLYKRDFALRDPLEPEVEAAFTKQGLHYIDEVLWQLRVKLAATVSRLRIKSGAHSLSKLLPRHLRNTRSALDENIITGWVNFFKTTVKDATNSLESMDIVPLSRDKDCLEPLTYKTDHVLPRFLHIMPNQREELVETPLVRDYHLVMQERTFCLGPAIMAQLLKDYALSGKVAQTHVNSPTTTAYFANLLINNDKIEALLVFGAGYRKEACEQYLQELGVKNAHVYSESFAGLAAESRVLDNVIAVLATPPNTNSSVVDPVDLAVARGGDLQILQQLTDDDFASTPRDEHINKFLIDQRDTLRRAMSKPQIQFVVYETHSRFHCENEEMAANLVNELNNYAAEVHLEELRKAQGESTERDRNQAEPSGDTPAELPVIRVDEETKELSLPIPTPPVQSVVVPPSDLFELADLPDICPNMENCLDLVSEGMYVAFIKRKEIIRLDPKYMIQMAEARGLFGRPEGTPKEKKSGQTARAKAALAALQARSDTMSDKSKTKVKVEMERIAAPTRASLLRDVHPPPAKECPRHVHHLAHDGTPSYLVFDCGERKTFLTPAEEEALIRRLYFFPRVNVYTPKLYEELPPLKFWNSPASVIQNYLRRKVFQRRLQLAYQFNQMTESEHQLTSRQTLRQAPGQFSDAITQLTEDIGYFESIVCQQNAIHDKCQKLEAEKIAHTLDTTRSAYKNQNKRMWDTICPETVDQPVENCIEKSESVTTTYNGTVIKQLKDRYFNYKEFYRLRNVRATEEKPLALTIGMDLSESNSQLSETSEHEEISELIIDQKDDILTFQKTDQVEESVVTEVTGSIIDLSGSFVKTSNEKHQIKNKAWQRRQALLKVLSDSGMSESQTKSLGSGGRLPKITYSSLDTLRETVFLNEDVLPATKHDGFLLPQKSVTPEEQTRSPRNTIGLRDSVLLTRKRTKSVLSRKITEQVSYLSLASQHRDSLSITHSKRSEKSGVKSELESFKDVNVNVLNKDKEDYQSNKTISERSASVIFEPPTDNYQDQDKYLSVSTLGDHHDSILLAVERLTLKDKDKIVEPIECDVCNNYHRSSTVQFICNLHSGMYDPKPQKRGHQSILSKTRSLLQNHVDSIVLLKNEPSKDTKQSQSCQTEGDATSEDKLLNKQSDETNSLAYGRKESQKTVKVADNPNKDLTKMTASNLKDYLMESIKINQIIT